MVSTLTHSPRVFAHHLAASGAIPNHARWPLLIYTSVVAIAAADPAADFETLFDRNGWPAAWRNGVHPFHHFHCDAHEALGVFSGEVTVQFGGEGGVVGAYPAGQCPDMCTPMLSNLKRSAAAVARVMLPQRDPVYGEDGPLFTHWK